MKTIHSLAQEKIYKEQHFEIFKSEGFICAVLRMTGSGHFCGYVGVDKKHPFYKKHYSEKVEVKNVENISFNGNYISLLSHSLDDERKENEISLDLFLDVHGGLTYSSKSIYGLDEKIFPQTWWFGFDTAHSGDVRPIQNEIDVRFSINGDEYRDFEYVKIETEKLAKQLKNLKNE